MLQFRRCPTRLDWGRRFLQVVFLAAIVRVSLAGEHPDYGLPNYDIRFDGAGNPAQRTDDDSASRSAIQGREAALKRLRIRVESVVVDDDPILNTPRFVRSLSQLLTEANSDHSPKDVVQGFVEEFTPFFEIAASEVLAAKVTRDYADENTGIAHLTLQQQSLGIDIFGAEIRANTTRDGRLINIGSTMVPRPPAGFQIMEAKQSDIEAIRLAAASVGVVVQTDPTPAEPPEAQTQRRRWNNSSDFRTDMAIVTKRVLFPVSRHDIRPAWQVLIPVRGVGHTYELVLDAIEGTVLHRVNLLAFDSYRAYNGTGAGPQCSQRMLFATPASPIASPFGWFDTDGIAGPEFNDTRGNNVSAQEDVDENNMGGFRPSGGSELRFEFPIDFTQEPNAYQAAAIAQAFYFANVFHDRLYAFGFTPAAGNFQTNNYGMGGLGNDAIQFDVQDGSGTNNANFLSPVDGIPGRCQMYLWTHANPDRDSTLDGTIVFHELTHGVSHRLTGGPANANALDSVQSRGMLEGWSDFVALWMTSLNTDEFDGAYPIGTYVLSQDCCDRGVRIFPYSTDLAIDPLDFDSYGTGGGLTSYGVQRSTAAHWTGTIWASTLWDLYWLLVDKYGYDANLGTGWSAEPGPANAGNKLALRLIVDAMKLQPANPSFIQARDALLAADIALNGGVNTGFIWTAFAKRRLGQGALTLNSNSTATPTLSSDTPLFVTTTTPTWGTIGSHVTTTPSSYVINVNHPLTPATVNAGDLRVNGVMASLVAYTPGSNTMTFTFGANPVTSPGMQTMQINAGAFNRASDGQSVSGFNGWFYYDAFPMAVTATNPPHGSVIEPGPFDIDVFFSEVVDPVSVQSSDLTLSIGAVTGVTMPDSQTVRFTVSGIVEAAPLNISLAVGSVSDTSGNPNPAAFAATYNNLDTCEDSAGNYCDCNGNGIPDTCDIDASDPDGDGQVHPDCNGNSVPDPCEIGQLLEGQELAGAVPGDLLGLGVAIENRTAMAGAIGANGGAGAVVVYEFDGVSWQLHQTLTAASDAGLDDRFGQNVAMSGDVAIISAHLNDDVGSNSGSAYIFRKVGGNWMQEQKLTASDAASQDQYGYSVAIDGDVAVVGSWFDDDNASTSGSVYVYRYNGQSWVEDQKLHASDAGFQDRYGKSVAIFGEVIVVGAYLEDELATDAGAAYVYRYNGANWVEEQKLTGSIEVAGGCFGWSVSVNGDAILVGRTGCDDPFVGTAAYVFRWNGATWIEEQVLRGSDGLVGGAAGFGEAVALYADSALIGADNAFGGGCAGVGAAYLFAWNGSTWDQVQRLVGSTTNCGDAFGQAVALKGNRAMIGAVTADGGGIGSGAAYIFGMATDCNGNGSLDECDIANGEPDQDGSGLPDACEGICNGDPDAIDEFTEALLEASQDPGDLCRFDLDASGGLDGRDIEPFVEHLLAP